MQVVNHRLSDVRYDPAREIGHNIEPKFLVMHYTAGYTLESAVQTFKTTAIAAHLIIDRDGSAVQMAPLNKRCNHAGPSEWMGVSMLNNHSIGIEFVNIGWAKERADGRLVDAYGKLVAEKEAETWIRAPNPRVGSGTLYWQPYTEEQILTGLRITQAILDVYPTIKDIVSHEEIDTRKWKTDPGPAFPMNRFGGLLRGVEALGSTDPLKGMTGTVNTATLNVRGGPGSNFPVIGSSKLGSRLGILEFRDGWYRIHTERDGVQGSGWVSSQFVTVG